MMRPSGDRVIINTYSREYESINYFLFFTQRFTKNNNSPQGTIVITA